MTAKPDAEAIATRVLLVVGAFTLAGYGVGMAWPLFDSTGPLGHAAYGLTVGAALALLNELLRYKG